VRFRFLPQQARFFDEFTAMAGRVQDGARLLRGMLGGAAPDHAKAEEIRLVEHDCDERTHAIIQRLNTTFVTPLDREDIHALARTLDDVMDAIDAAATLFPLYEIATMRKGAAELAAVIAQQADQLRLATEALEKRVGVQERIREIHTFEHEADLIHRDAVQRLFREERDPIAIIQWKEILDLLEAATDAAEAVADVLEGIFLKHS
jgi:predicted phosphate transport protein (TIGR00153 family)